MPKSTYQLQVNAILIDLRQRSFWTVSAAMDSGPWYVGGFLHDIAKS